MASPKYPKVKGCYQCSQRRISCDRTGPQCHKCTVKGLECSGLGLRYRFEADVGARGKRVQKTAPPVVRARKRSKAPRDMIQSKEASILSETADFNVISPTDLSIIPKWKEFLHSYFSDNIAPQMLAIDDPANEWRRLVLSASLADEVVNHAVLAASAYHASVKSASMIPVAQKSYTTAIKGLQMRRDLQSLDKLINCYNILTILLLLVAAMATGEPDFPPLFKMLKCALKTVEEIDILATGELGEFLLRQIRKLSVYAEPLLSEQSGVEAVWARTQGGFECLERCATLHPEHAMSLSNVKSQIEQAYTIYLYRALNIQQEPCLSLKRVEQFKRTVEEYPKGQPGEHVLVWASFIAAAESATQEHRAFFAERMQHLCRINGFGNIPKAIRLLKTIWNYPVEASWTNIIAQA